MRFISLWIILKLFIRLFFPICLFLFYLFSLWYYISLRGFILTTLTNILLLSSVLAFFLWVVARVIPLTNCCPNFIENLTSSVAKLSKILVYFSEKVFNKVLKQVAILFCWKSTIVFVCKLSLSLPITRSLFFFSHSWCVKVKFFFLSLILWLRYSEI